MSIPDRLIPGYLAALTELLDPEIEALAGVAPMRVKMLLAGDVTATIHGLDPAAAAREEFTAQFSRRRFSDLTGVPTLDRSATGDSTVAELFVKATALIGSLNQVRRVAAGGGLRVVIEAHGHAQRSLTLSKAQADAPVAEVIPASAAPARTFVKCGRAVVELR